MRALYNELDAYAARWLGSLSAAGHVAAGDVDTRSNGAQPSRPTPAPGPWRSDPDWVWCVDRGGVWRPVEPGTFPLAHGAPARVGRLRAYGNAIVAQVAATFVTAFMEVTA